ncbi:Uncharacterized protein Rs2_22878 [Raphanus sativus]|nr:Uncharacterized protein Rs2_22878 [Raphanus sativus]
MVAQPAQDSTDLRSPPTNLPSAKTEIVKQLTDPSSGEKDVGNTLDELSPVASAEAPQLDKPHVELSTVAKSTCSSVSILATGEVEQTSTEALSTEVSASAEAKEVPLSSQQDANKVPPTGVTGELATSNLADAERNSPAAWRVQDWQSRLRLRSFNTHHLLVLPKRFLKQPLALWRL